MASFEVGLDEDLGPVAAALCDGLEPGAVVYLEGPIGAGKTTLVQACARVLGVTEPVTSPTFALAHQYAGTTAISHLDLYRLATQPQRDAGDLLAYLDEQSISFVEWPGLGADWLPPATLVVQIDPIANGARRIAIERPHP